MTDPTPAPLSAEMRLPELPYPAVHYGHKLRPAYSAKHMREYAQAAVALARRDEPVGADREQERQGLAEALWQHESQRAAGRSRRILWMDENDQERARWLGYADVALARPSITARPAVPEELVELSNAAHPGPWHYHECVEEGVTTYPDGTSECDDYTHRELHLAPTVFNEEGVTDHPYLEAGGGFTVADLKLIASAVNHLRAELALASQAEPADGQRGEGGGL